MVEATSNKSSKVKIDLTKDGKDDMINFQTEGDEVLEATNMPRLSKCIEYVNGRPVITVSYPSESATDAGPIDLSASGIKIEEGGKTSPRSKVLNKKFGMLKENEWVMESYSCAASIRILLQGMLYVTNKSIYFYSPFNNKTVLGHGTKIKISYGSIKKIKKETKLLVFPNSIRFSLNSGEELLFTSFISRDTCY